MASEWARKKAAAFRLEACDCPDKNGRKKVGQGAYRRFYCAGCLAEALDAARAEEAWQSLMSRAEKAEAELDKLRADLDAALVLCVASDWDVEVLGAGYEPEVYKAHAHVLPLLEKRRVENRG